MHTRKYEWILCIGKVLSKLVVYFLYDPTTKQISGVSWQNIDREKVKKEFLDGGVVRFLASCTLEMFPVVVLGGGDTEWVACALGKENMAGSHCNHTAGDPKRIFTFGAQNH
jgi:hypothetical protein